MVNNRFWEVIKRFNFLMKSSIEGPNCLDICNGDCCSIKIDVPKILAKEYIKRGYATKEDFIRSDTFSFKLRFDEKQGKCFLFDKVLNGCSVHESGIKPPQCWIYPTKFSYSENVQCKKANGWKIINPKNTEAAEELLKYYVFLCQLEAKKELRIIRKNFNKKDFIENNLFINFSPHQIAGFKITWDGVKILPAEGISLQLKKFCLKYNPNCDYIPQNFLECEKVCNIISEKLIEFFQKSFFDYLIKERLDTDGEYPLYKLLEFNNNF